MFMADKDEILTIDELAEWLKATTTQIYEMTRTRYAVRHGIPLPNFRVGQQMRFRRSDVEQWIEKTTRK
jgi:excisionase family DNA binding protein